MTSISSLQATCLESVLVDALHVEAIPGANRRLQMLLMLVFGRRVIDARAGITRDRGVYDGRNSIGLQLLDVEVDLLLEACAWARANGDPAGYAHGELLDQVTASLECARAEGLVVRPPLLAHQSSSDNIAIAMDWDQGFELLESTRRVFQSALVPEGTRLVGQDEISDAYWTVYEALESSRSSETAAVQVRLPMQTWTIFLQYQSFRRLEIERAYCREPEREAHLLRALSNDGVMNKILRSISRQE
jgi:hypothetical protein